MNCLYCGKDQSKVIDKRAVKGSGEIRRRRECLKCGKRYTTYERLGSEFYIIKRDGRKETYSREKLRSGLSKALEKRPSLDKIDEVVERIEKKVKSKGKEITSKAIGQMVLSELKRVDKVAYLRFASVYRGFSELGDFQKELQGLN